MGSDPWLSFLPVNRLLSIVMVPPGLYLFWNISGEDDVCIVKPFLEPNKVCIDFCILGQDELRFGSWIVRTSMRKCCIR